MNSVTIDTIQGVCEGVQRAEAWPVRKQQEFRELASFLRFGHAWAPPITIIPGEAPDFNISGVGLNASVELTYAASQSWEDAEAALGRPNPPAPLISRISLDGIRYRGRRLRAYLANHAPEFIWSADSQAQAKAAELRTAVQRKIRHSRSRCSLNWLLVIDKLPFLFLDLDAFVHHLPTSATPFDAIFFVSEREFKKRRMGFLVEIASSGARVVSISDGCQSAA
jgi:hypothetical protein